MNKKMMKLAMSVSAMGLAGVLVAACTGKKGDDDTGTQLDVVQKGGGGDTNFTCNGTFTDPVSSGSSMTVNFVVRSQEGAGTPPLSPDTYVGVFDPAVGNTTGNFAVTDANGEAQLTLMELTRYTFLNSKDPATHVSTYTYDVLTPALGETDPIGLNIVSHNIVNAITATLSIPPEDIEGLVQVAGAIYDCDGDRVQNAIIEVPDEAGTGVAMRCGEEGHGYPCIAYFSGSLPSKTRTFTDESGQFAIIGLPPGEVTVEAFGVLTEGEDPEAIGVANLNGEADSIGIASTYPLPGVQ